MAIDQYGWDKNKLDDLKAADAAAKHLAEVKKDNPVVIEDKLDQERCLWLLSEKTTFEEYKKAVTEVGDNTSAWNEEFFKKEKRRWAYQWLKRIVNEHQLQDIPIMPFYLDRLEMRGFRREEMVHEIIGSKKKGITDYFYDEKGSIDYPARRHLKRLAEWFITRRYDISSARWLVLERLKLEKKKYFSVEKGWIYLSVILAFVFTTLGLANHTLIWEFFNFDKLKLIIISKPQTIGLILCAVAYAVLISKIVDIIIYPFKALLLTPRFLASLLVGYLPLVLAKDIWSFVLNGSWPLICIIIIFMLFLSYIYLLFEINKTMGEAQKGESFYRSFCLFIRGLIFSFGIGFLLLDWFAAFFILEVAPKNPSLILWGYIGIIPIKVLFLFATTALLLGIVLQAIWEDKPITEPL